MNTTDRPIALARRCRCGVTIQSNGVEHPGKRPAFAIYRGRSRHPYHSPTYIRRNVHWGRIRVAGPSPRRPDKVRRIGTDRYHLSIPRRGSGFAPSIRIGSTVFWVSASWLW